MALRTRYAGSGLGLKPISIGDDPYSADSEFDSTVRIPSVARPAAKIAPPSITAMPSAGIAPPAPAPIAPQQPVPQPQVQPPTPIAPPTITQPPPTGLDPTQLNYQGQTFDPGISQYTDETVLRKPTSQDLDAIQKFMDDNGVKINKDWRSELGSDPAAFVKKHWQVSGLGGYTQNLLTTSQKAENPDYQIRYLQQQLFNSGLDRLKQAGAAGAREQDEELMAMLASRGLLDSGIAAKVIGQLQEERNRNLYEGANRLNELLLSGDISRLTGRDLATLEADLQKRNQESLLRLQQALAQANQPDPFAQFFATAIGTGLPFLLAPKAPGTDEGASRLYSADPGSTPQVNQRGNTYRYPRAEP